MTFARLLVVLILTSVPVAVKAQSPTLYFTDLTSGPAGAIVTVYGANLSSSVTFNDVSATVIASSPQKVSFIVPNTTSGPISIGESNSLPFTVRSGNIYYVAANGSDSQSGSQSAPWRDIPYAFNTASCGDIIYIMDGVSQTGLDNYDASLSVERVCDPTQPLALVGYPGATVTIGSATGPEYGIRNPDVGGDGFNGMVFANLVVRGNNEGIKTVGNQYWRIVGSDFSCPNGGGESACVLVDNSSNIQFLGNSIHDTGAGGTKYYHSFYATTNSNDIEVGWNNIYNNQSCRGIQFYSTSGSPQYNLIVHDNIVTGQLCDGINFSTVDATQGPIEAYNNLVYHVGLGGSSLGDPNMACIASLGLGASGGEALFFGNTLADCGSGGGSTAGAITVQDGSPIAVTLSNLVIQSSGEPIYSPNTDTSLVQSNHDVLLTKGPAGIVDSTYHLVTGSPAIGAGIALPGVFFDLQGLPRPQSGSEDAGAYLYTTGTVSSAPVAVLSPSSINFGNQATGTTSSPSVVILTNTGGGPLALSSVSITGSDPTAFAQSDNCGSSLAAHSSCTISIKFSPAAAEAYSASLSVADNASGSPQTVTLTGTGIASEAPAASIAPASLSFSGSIGTTTTPQTVTLTNSGAATLNISAISITGAGASAFSQTSTCGATLAASSRCTISIKFSASAATTYSATLNIADNASGTPQTVALTGTGVASQTPVVSVTPASLSFSATVGTTTAPRTVTLTNSGTATLNISAISITGTGASTFSHAGTCGASLAAGSSCSIFVTFSPSAATTYSATLDIADNASGSPQTVTLSGTGIAPGTPAVSIRPASLTFSGTVGATSTPQTLTLRNIGTATLEITSVSITGAGASSFLQTNTCGASLAAGSRCTISITFSPAAATTYSASLDITDNASGSPQAAALTGTGTAPALPAASITPASLSFSGTVGTVTAPQTVTLTNTGTATLEIASISFTGAGASSFSQTGTCGTSLAAGSSCSISVAFSPAAAATYSAFLSVADNASGSPQTVALTGVGTAAATPDFTLSATPASQSIQRGGSATFTLTLISINGAFANPVTLSASGYPSGTTITFSPGQLVPTGTGSTSVLTVQTSASASNQPVRSRWPLAIPVLAFLLWLPRRRSKCLMFLNLLLLLSILATTVLLQGCGAVYLPHQPSSGATNYTLNITGASATASHATSVQLNMQ